MIFMKDNKPVEQLRQEREKRINDAIQLKVPDRVPIVASFSYFPAKYVAGITCKDAFYDPVKWKEACKKTILDFAPDNYTIHSNISGPVMDALGVEQLLFPGHGTSADISHQFVETDYMKANEYDAFLADPSDYAIRVFTPRIFSKLKALEKLPPLDNLVGGGGIMFMLEMLTQPEFQEALEALIKAGEETQRWRATMGSLGKEMEALGFPAGRIATSWAPFDLLPDMLRGMKGSMLDMYRQPEKVLAACEKILPMSIEKALTVASITGGKTVFIPLHRGAMGFMSIKQFEKFYWPTLKKLMLALIDAGLIPAPFIEGDYTDRLEYFLELPKGKVVGHFDTTDIFKAKKILGGHMCLQGNMPASLLQTGTPQAVKDYTKKLIDVVGKDGGYIMACRSSLDEANPQLVKVWMDYTREYGVYG
jgi:uroporphyrinogen-III decarboxylase